MSCIDDTDSGTRLPVGTRLPGGTRPSEDIDPYCLTDGEAARLLAGAPWQRLVLVGDSIAEGVREPAHGYRNLGWGDRLAAALAVGRPAFAWSNLGRRGLLAAEVRAGQLLPALAFSPDLAVVACGGNDLLQRGFDPGAVEAELSAIVGPLREAGATVVTIGLFDITRAGIIPEPFAGALSRGIHALAARTKAVAVRHGAVFVDCTSHPAGADDGIYSSDGLHLNARGHAVAAAETIRALAGHDGRTNRDLLRGKHTDAAGP